jgi:hypothetical protein
MPPLPSSDDLALFAQHLRDAVERYHQAREGYRVVLAGPPGSPAVSRSIPRDVNLGPSPANPYLGSPPPLWEALPKRRLNEPPADWINRCAVAAINAAVSILATEDGWAVEALPGPTPGWRIRKPGNPDHIDLHTGNVATMVPWKGKTGGR